MATHIVVSLPDGYNGHTENFIGEPVQRDGNLVKLRCAGRGREHLIRWISEADLQTAIASQIAGAKAWEYRDEQEGVEFLSLDRLPAEKRDQWTSERPLDAVPASLVGLDVGATDQSLGAPTSRAMAVIEAASESPKKLLKVARQVLGRPPEEITVSDLGRSPIPGTVVATHASYPIECHAAGVVFSDGRVVIDYPFRWIGVQDQSFDSDAQIDISHVILPDGRELHEGWRDIGVGDITARDYADLQSRVEALELSIAKGEELPTTDALLARYERVMDQSRWTIDMDSGKVIDKRWTIEDLPKAGAEYKSVDDGFDGLVTVKSVSGDTVFYEGDADGSSTVSEFKRAYAPARDLGGEPAPAAVVTRSRTAWA